MKEDPVAERLAVLRARTEALRARPGFQARVLLAVQREAAGAFSLELWRQARWFVPAALALTVLSLGAASLGSEVTSAELASAQLSLELETW